MTWEDTVIKSGDIRWRSKAKSTNDGQLDVDIHVPLTNLFRSQAKISFGKGVSATVSFFVDQQAKRKPLTIEDVAAFFVECGLPDQAEELRAGAAAVSSVEGKGQ